VGSDITEIGKFWLSPKKYVLVNIITVVVLWSIWKLMNEFCFQRIGWKSMEVLLFKVRGHLKNWQVLCPADKKEQLVGYLEDIKMVARRTRWLPDIQRGVD
jgi:hypothetical protein